MGGNTALHPFWRFARLPASVHNLGGCPIADSPDQGVANAYDEVFGYPGMFILDGAATPVAIGANPSHTITAMAERNIEVAIRRIVNDPNWHAPEAPAPSVVDPLSNVVIPPGGVPPLPLITGASTQPPPTVVQSRITPIFDSSVAHQVLAYSAISNVFRCRKALHGHRNTIPAPRLSVGRGVDCLFLFRSYERRLRQRDCLPAAATSSSNTCLSLLLRNRIE
jgi:hypothetical protein